MHPLRCGLITLEPPDGGVFTSLVDGFTDNGCEVEVLHRHLAWDLQKYDFLISYGPMQSMAWAIVRLSQAKRLPPLAVWFTEQVAAPQPNRALYLAARVRYFLEEYPQKHSLPAVVKDRPAFAQLAQKAGRLRALGEMLALKSHGMLNLLCVFTETNASFFRRYGLPVTVIPMGWHPQLSRPVDGQERAYDVVFLGSTRDPRRGEIIQRLDDGLRARGVKFVIKDGSPERGHVFGEERSLLLNRSKIMLNIMRQPWDDPAFRMLLAAPAGAMLLSEKLLPTSTGAFQPGKHFAMADLNGMVDAVEYYLSHEDERRAIARQAFDYVTGELTMRNMAHRLLSTLCHI